MAMTMGNHARARQRVALTVVVVLGSILGTSMAEAKEERRRERSNEKRLGEDPLGFADTAAMLAPRARDLDAQAADYLLQSFAAKSSNGCFPELPNPGPCGEDLAKLDGAPASLALVSVLGKAAQATATHIRPMSREQPASALEELRSANAAYEAHRLDEAAERYRGILRQWPGHLDARNNLALTEIHRQHDASALYHGMVVVAVAPRYAGARLNITVALARLGLWTEARSTALKTAAENRKFPAAQFNAAWFQNAAGEYAAAVRSIAAALESMSDYPKAKQLAVLNALEAGAMLPNEYTDAFPYSERSRLKRLSVEAVRVSVPATAYFGATPAETLPAGTVLVVSQRRDGWLAFYRIAAGTKHRVWLREADCRIEPTTVDGSGLLPPVVLRPPSESPETESAPGAQTHDGFYLRMSGGLGYVSDWLSGTSYDGHSMKGQSRGPCIVPMDVAIGGTIGSLAVGGILTYAINPTVGKDSQQAALYIFTGGFADYFPDPHGGLHIGTAVGVAIPTLGSSSDSSSSSSRNSADPGVGAMLMGGYDFWVSDQWSLGASARVIFLRAGDDNGIKHAALIPHIALSALYH
jgi:tetratricopeptide (TPR) repeat protein